MVKKVKKAKNVKGFDPGVPPGLAKKDVVLEWTDDSNMNVFVAHNDKVWVDGKVTPQAVVVHDGDIVRVDIDGDGVFEINPPEAEP